MQLENMQCIPTFRKNTRACRTRGTCVFCNCSSYQRMSALCPGHEWLAIVVLWFHWNVFILATATSTFEQRNSARNGSDRASGWSYQEYTSCYMRKKKVFFVPWTSFVNNFPLSIVLLTICEFVGLFEVFRPVIFTGTLCIFEYFRIRDRQPIS